MRPSEIRVETTMAAELVYPLRYIHFTSNTNPPAETIELGGGVILDIDVNGDVVGIEVI